jgi:hypothetical protein
MNSVRYQNEVTPTASVSLEYCYGDSAMASLAVIRLASAERVRSMITVRAASLCLTACRLAIR